MEREYYQVFVDSIHDSDVYTCDTYEEAIEEARNWKLELTQQSSNERIIIVKITEEVIDEL